MASITSAGLGSGLDIENIISSLMSVERRPITLLQQKGGNETTRLSALGQVKGALSGLQAAAQALDTRSDFVAFKSSMANSSVASASVGNNAVAGTYSIEVTALASAQKIKSGGYATSTTAITSNTLPATLTLEIGTTSGGIFSGDSSKTKTFTIDSSNNSLEGLRDAINASKGGVNASLVNDGGATPFRLVLTSDTTGIASSFKLSGLSDFSYDPATGTGNGLSTINSASNAALLIDGISVSKTSNVITDAIQGVTLSLSETNEGSPTTLNVSNDNSTIQSKVAAFVSAFNAVNSLIKTQTAYNPETRTAGTLNGDATVRNIQSQLKDIITSVVGSGATTRLSDVGISFQRDGTLAIDGAKFQSALSDTTKDVAGLFAKDTSSGITGVASLISSRITDMLGVGGLLTARTDGINASLKNMDKRIEILNARMAGIETRYRAQFTALDTTIASMNSTSSFLTQQLSALANMYNRS